MDLTSYNRRRDSPQFDDAENIVPTPQANTREGRIVDLALAADEAKRLRSFPYPTINDRQVAHSLLLAHRSLTEATPEVEAIVGPLMARMNQVRHHSNTRKLWAFNQLIDGDCN
jgi:hypothetical protein